MLIKGEFIHQLLDYYNIQVKGILHIGAHECEEMAFYKNILHMNDENVIWIDGNTQLIQKMKQQHPTYLLFDAVLDQTEHNTVFNITSNTQASSILQLNHEQGFYNDIHIQQQINCTTQTLPQFIQKNNVDITQFNFWNLDIQGTELNVLKGSLDLLQYCDAIYTEVNIDYVYKECGLINELDALLKEYDFKRIYTYWTDMKWGDAIYIKTSKY